MRRLLPLCLLLALTACGARELSAVTLLRTLGVDGPGPVALTALAGGEDEGLYRTVGADISLAQEALRGLGADRVETTHIQQLVLGPGTDVARCLWRELIHRKSGYGATVWLRRESTAAALLEQTRDLSGRLSNLAENGGAEAPTILEALSDLRNRGRTRLPVLAGTGERVRVAGYETVEVEGP